jgi:2-dehydro-3-deoxygluconokinase
MGKDINILCVGESMLELREQDGSFSPAFAGDILNFSVYLKRLSPSSEVNLFTAIGQDNDSEKMLAFFKQEGINTHLVFSSPDKTVGLYRVHTDDEGERTFSYWRSDSAAKKMFSIANEVALFQIAEKINYLYFSGITLAILDPHDRDQLFRLAERVRNNGKTVIFDPNFRQALWGNTGIAKLQMKRAYTLANILLTSYQDEQLLFGKTTIRKTLDRLQSFNIDEIVLTDGPDQIHGVFYGELFSVAPKKAEEVIDTTSAGDAFNAAYIVARHANRAPDDASSFASLLASRVVGFPGAIMPEEFMADVASSL